MAASARSAGLGAVERSVGQSHQFVRLDGSRGKEGEAAGAGQANAERGHVERRCEDRLDFLTQRDRLVARADSIAEDGEFVAADPRGGATPIHRSGEPVGDLPEDIVSGRMPMSVVDGLEAVEIDQAQCERLAGLLCDDDPVSEQALKAAPVGEPGQIVGQRDGHRRFSRLLGNPLHFGDHEP